MGCGLPEKKDLMDLWLDTIARLEAKIYSAVRAADVRDLVISMGIATDALLKIAAAKRAKRGRRA